MAGQANGTPANDALDDLLPGEEDLLFEEELLRNPYALRMWHRYLDARKSANPRKRYLLYERALNALPGSYKVHRLCAACLQLMHLATSAALLDASPVADNAAEAAFRHILQ